MGNERIQLGQAAKRSTVVVLQPKSVEERLQMLEEKLAAMTAAFYATRRVLAKKGRTSHDAHEESETVNGDDLPLNTAYLGITKGVPYILTVNDIGEYIVGGKKFGSLSAAAEHVSGVRRSGWTFWKTFDGKTLKEAFRE